MKTILLFAVFTLSACTEQQRTRQWGGKSTIRLTCDSQLKFISWKKDDLWYSTVDFEPGHTPETHTFRESSFWGLQEGVVVIVETSCKDQK